MRVLVVCPSWVGDAVMATPALGLVRDALPGAFIGALCRPGIDELLAGHRAIDEFHVEHARGVMGPKFVAAKIRPRRYDAALLLTNSFSTALVTRIAGIARRVGYDRDGRGFLLTHKLPPVRTASGKFEIVSAVSYYWNIARWMLVGMGADVPREVVARTPPRNAGDLGLPTHVRMELAASGADEALVQRIFAHTGLASGPKPVMLNPGGNNEAKRWPAERFAQLADHVAREHARGILINGSPAERDLCEKIAGLCEFAKPIVLPELVSHFGATLGTLKAMVARCGLMITNDTGPRHIAAAMGVPVVSLFGPTDHRWTIVPTIPGAREWIIPADPTLPESERANDHPERCAITKIDVESVESAVDEALGVEFPAGGGMV